MLWVSRAQNLQSAEYIVYRRYRAISERQIPVSVGMGLVVSKRDRQINTKRVPGLHNRMFSG